MNLFSDPKLQEQEPLMFSRSTIQGVMGAMDAGAGARVVNRTHRVVRERARVIQERRNRHRSLMLPLIVCSAMLMLVCLGIWTGLDQYEAAQEIAQADVTALATAEANNHFLLILLWFVPVSLAVLATIWFRRSRNGARGEVL